MSFDLASLWIGVGSGWVCVSVCVYVCCVSQEKMKDLITHQTSNREAELTHYTHLTLPLKASLLNGLVAFSYHPNSTSHIIISSIF